MVFWLVYVFLKTALTVAVSPMVKAEGVIEVTVISPVSVPEDAALTVTCSGVLRMYPPASAKQM